MNQRTGAISWVHFGDLHLRHRDDENYSDFLQLVEAANRNLAGKVDFVYLPGDNAEDGIGEQYELVRDGLDRLQLPFQIVTGDHDRKTGSLRSYREFLEPELYRSLQVRNFQLLFLNAMDGTDAKTFDFGPEQLAWLKDRLHAGISAGSRPLIFVHLYPSELVLSGAEFSRLVRESGVEIVEMGHTHYNEIANDGRTIYATTRSTGQIEEGPPGFSVTVIDGDVISWKFNERGSFPFVMITSPSDYRLITDPRSSRHVLKGVVPIRARAWDGRGIRGVLCSIDNAPQQPMHRTHDGFWELLWDTREAASGQHEIRVTAETAGQSARDLATVAVFQEGEYALPQRHPIDYDNAIRAWPEKGVLGTQLGPNELGTKGPWPSWKHRR